MGDGWGAPGEKGPQQLQETHGTLGTPEESTSGFDSKPPLGCGTGEADQRGLDQCREKASQRQAELPGREGDLRKLPACTTRLRFPGIPGSPPNAFFRAAAAKAQVERSLQAGPVTGAVQDSGSNPGPTTVLVQVPGKQL